MPTYNFKAIQEFLWFVFLEFAAVVTLAFYNSETVTDWRTWVGITVLNGLRAAAGYIISWINARRAPVPQ